ncbi:MAG: hypothetical protein MJ252_22605, partial [archaeon]|nr:hypothetical protein [archaeon]
FKESYSNYFSVKKSKILNAYGIQEDDALLGISKFVLILCFNTTELRPVIRDIIAVDPLNNYKEYGLTFEEESFSEYLFVSGEAVYIEGDLINNGETISVKKILHGIELVGYAANEEQINQIYSEHRPFLIYAFNGPYFSKSNLDLKMFGTILSQVASKNPHAIILNGPFIPTDNEIIESRDINFLSYTSNKTLGDQTYEDLFEEMMKLIAQIFANTKTKIYICPSLLDEISFYPLPQPKFNFEDYDCFKTDAKLSKGDVKSISNPCIFMLNEMLFANCNYDVVKDIINNSIRSKNKSPIDSALSTILLQKSMYPLLPNTNNEDQDKIGKFNPIDINNISFFSFDILPDIFIVNSNLTSFIKKNNNTIFFNPGQFFKGNTLGTFCKITLHPPSVRLIYFNYF